MKKVGIITFHNTINFGASLQCFALQETISTLGYKVDVINHHNKKIDDSYRLYSSHIWSRSFWGIAKSLIYHTILNLRKIKAYSRFELFMRRKLNVAEDDTLNGYDTLVYGSDQIWKIGLTNNDLFYFGFGAPTLSDKIAYAASAGKIDEEFYDNIKYLHGFKAISVRESSLANTLNKYSIDASVVLDPTLLLTGEEWVYKLNLRRSSSSSEYVLVYAMQDLDSCLNYAKHVAKLKGIKVKIVYPSVEMSNVIKRNNDLGPIQFLELLLNAYYIITDSFHGTAFAVNFQKDFYTMKQGLGFDGRAESLLNLVGLQSRMVSPSSLPERIEDIDYSEVSARLQQIREESVDFLRSNI